MSADKYPSIFSRQMEAIVYIYVNMWMTKDLDSRFKHGLSECFILTQIPCLKDYKNDINLFTRHFYHWDN